MPSDLSWVESLLYRLITAPSGVAEGRRRRSRWNMAASRASSPVMIA